MQGRHPQDRNCPIQQEITAMPDTHLNRVRGHLARTEEAAGMFPKSRCLRLHAGQTRTAFATRRDCFKPSEKDGGTVLTSFCHLSKTSAGVRDHQLQAQALHQLQAHALQLRDRMSMCLRLLRRHRQNHVEVNVIRSVVTLSSHLAVLHPPA